MIWRLRHQGHEVVGDALGGMARYSSFVEIIPEDRADAEQLDGFQICDDLRGPFEGVLGFHLRGSGCAIDEGVVEKLGVSVPIERADVVGGA